MRRSLDLQTGLVARAADRRDRVANALETEHCADAAPGNRNRLAARIRHRHFVYVIGCGALGDLHICYLADGVACGIHLLLNLIGGERHRPSVLARVLIRVSLALEVRVIAAPDVRCVLGCAAVRRIKVTDDRAAVVRQRFTLGGVHCGIRGLGCTVGAQIHLTVRGVAQIVITAVLVCAECERTSTDCLRLLRLGRPVRVDLIRQHTLHIILHTHIVYNSDAAVRCAAVHKITVPLVALEPRQRAVRTDGDMVCTRCGRIQHRAAVGIADLKGIVHQLDGQRTARDRLAAGERGAADGADRVAGFAAANVLELRCRKGGSAADRQTDTQACIAVCCMCRNSTDAGDRHHSAKQHG